VLSGPFFEYLTAPNLVSVLFDEDVTASLSSADVVIRNLTTGAEFAPTGVTYEPIEDVFRVTYDLPTPLARGNYRATFKANEIRDPSNNPMAQDYNFDFFFLPGDANHDAKIDFLDLVRLAQNYNRSATGYDKADLNYDGRVDFADLVILAQNYNTALPSLPQLPLSLQSAFSVAPILRQPPQRPLLSSLSHQPPLKLKPAVEKPRGTPRRARS
jgi:hypothetical protein